MVIISPSGDQKADFKWKTQGMVDAGGNKDEDDWL